MKRSNQNRGIGKGSFLSGGCRSAQGSVMLEFVMVFPLVLILFFACLQLTHLWLAKMVVHYAAYCGARSALVCAADQYSGKDSAPSRAATRVCQSLQQSWKTSSGERTKSTIESQPEWNVTATTRHTFSLIVPMVGPIMAWGMNPWNEEGAWSVPLASNDNTDSLGYPTITLEESVTLPKPFVKMDRAIFPP